MIVVALALGSVLVALGRRGRRVDEHPVCRRCGRDLFKLESPQTCPECGRSLAAPRAIRTGNRRRMPWAIGVGSAAIVAGLIPLALVAAAAVIDVRNQPLWLLRRANNAAAVVEVDRRSQSGLLAAEQQASLVEQFLGDQADAEMAWVPEKGGFLWRQMAAGNLTPEQRQRWEEGSIAGVFYVKATIRSGTPLPYYREDDRLRTNSSERGASIRVNLAILRDGRPVAFTDADLHKRPSQDRAGQIKMPVDPPLPPGTYGLGVIPNPNQPFIGRELARFEVLPAETVLTTLVEDEPLRQRVEATVAFDADAMDAMWRRDVELFEAQRAMFNRSAAPRVIAGHLSVKGMLTPRLALAYEFVARADDGREFVGRNSVTSPAGEILEGGASLTVAVPADLPDDRLTLLLRPSINAAEGQFGFDTILAGEVALGRVPPAKVAP